VPPLPRDEANTGSLSSVPRLAQASKVACVAVVASLHLFGSSTSTVVLPEYAFWTCSENPRYLTKDCGWVKDMIRANGEGYITMSVWVASALVIRTIIIMFTTEKEVPENLENSQG
jgi:hypothetical protein